MRAKEREKLPCLSHSRIEKNGRDFWEGFHPAVFPGVRARHRGATRSFVGADKGAIDSAVAETERLHLLGNVGDGVHGEAVYGRGYRVGEALLEETA